MTTTIEPTTAPVSLAETALFDLDEIRMWNNARQRFSQ
jgi:hypothetical protein